MSAPDSVLVTFFPNRSAVQKTEQTLRLDDLAERVRQTSAPRKDALPWLKFARFGNLARDTGSLRHDGNVQRLSGIVADYDGEQITVDDAVERLEKVGV